MDKIKEKKLEKTHNKLRKFNKHINFKREGPKGNARKGDTKVFCCKCGKKAIVPFRPRDPEVYCDECFKLVKKNKRKF